MVTFKYVDVVNTQIRKQICGKMENFTINSSFIIVVLKNPLYKKTA